MAGRAGKKIIEVRTTVIAKPGTKVVVKKSTFTRGLKGMSQQQMRRFVRSKKTAAES